MMAKDDLEVNGVEGYYETKQACDHFANSQHMY